MKSSSLSVSGLLVAAICLAGATNADAALISKAYNFGDSNTPGTDVTDTAGYEDWIPADADYNATAGYGWTYTFDASADNNAGMLFRDRSGTSDPTPMNTLALDIRISDGKTFNNSSASALLRDPFTLSRRPAQRPLRDPGRPR